MAIAIVDNKASATLSSLTSSVTMTGPTNGNLMVALAGHYWKQTSETLTITTPASSYTQRVATTDVSFECFARAFTDTFTTGDGNTVTATASDTANTGTVLAVLELSGANAFDVGSSKVQSASASCSVPVTAAAATNGSLAVFMLIRNSAAEAAGTPTYTKTGTTSASWSELTKIQRTNNNVEIYVATATINSGETIGCDWSTTASATDTAAVIAVISPATNFAPTVSDPGTVYVATSEARTIGTLVTVADVDSNLSTIRYQCTEALGDLTVTLSGGATISAGTNGTHDLTVSGTNAELLTIHDTLSYTATADGTATVTITATDDEAASDSQAFSVISTYGVVEGTLAQVQATLNSVLEVQNDTAEMCTLGVTATDADANVGTGECAITFVSVIYEGGAAGASHNKVSHSIGLHF